MMATMADQLADSDPRSVVRTLTRSWVIALGVVAVLTVVAQVIIQLALARAELDARVMNLAGRQRMLSQAMTKAALDYHREPRPVAAARMLERRGEWLRGHELLARGDDLPGAGAANSPQVAAQFAELDPIVERMAAVSTVAEVREHLHKLLALEPEFLTRMDQLVDTYQEESTTRVIQVRILELVIFVTLMLVLFVEAWFVFRPTVYRLREGLRLRNRLLEQETSNQVLAAESRVAEQIGHDLHDGLGQRLTSLSLMGGRLLQEVGRNPTAVALVEGLGEAVADSRAVARRLAPVGIHRGLDNALSDLAEATRSGGMDCVYRSGGVPELQPRRAEDALRIAQEAVNNALRHAQAQHITIAAWTEHDYLNVVVSDDGIGLPADHGDGLGIHSMQLRSDRLRGTLRIGTLANGGAEIRCTFPVEHTHAD